MHRSLTPATITSVSTSVCVCVRMYLCMRVHVLVVGCAPHPSDERRRQTAAHRKSGLGHLAGRHTFSKYFFFLFLSRQLGA